MDRLFCSFSAGRSSAKMAQELALNYRDKYEIVFLLANTGAEDKKTLVFADRCDREFELNLVWVEAVTHPNKRSGCTHRIVTFETASRKEEPFRQMIAKYGIPNKTWPHCTRELKLNPMRSYLDSIGWHTGSYETAVGIRVDEPKRIKRRPGIVYPLVDWFPMTKPEINDHWASMPFDLGLEDYRGNCKTCWKKSNTKLVRIARETPKDFQFNAEMESQHGLAGENRDGLRRVFFRGHTSTEGILSLANNIERLPPVDDPDTDSGCSESCEAFEAVS